MAQLKIFWTATAIRQRNQVFEYWNERNKNTQYSKKLRTEINNRLSILIQHPKLGREADFKNTRVLSMGYYSIFYKLNNERVIYYRFLGQSSGPGKIVAITAIAANH